MGKKIRDADGKEYTVKEKKPFYKRWWFIGLAVIFVFGALAGGNDEDATSEDAATDDAVEEVEAAEDEEEVEVIKESTNDIVLGEPMAIGDYTMTVTDFSLGVDYDGNDALIITYDWENNSDEEASPFITFMFKAFQDSVETDDVFMVDGVDLGVGQKEIKAGGKIESAQDIVGIDNIEEVLLLEVDELISFKSNPYSIEIDLTQLD